MTSDNKKILTAQVGNNADLFPSILALYAKPGDVIADVTYGKGVFWKKVDTTIYKLNATDLAGGVDLRHLPYTDESHDMVVIDPPYIYNPKDTVKASLSAPYRVNESGVAGQGLTTTKAVRGLYSDGLAEAKRVLRRGGRCVVKCQDQIEANKQRWMHMDIHADAIAMGYTARDLYVLVQTSVPASRWKHQIHARKNHSYFWVFEK